MGRLYQLFAFVSVLCVFNYVWSECKGIRYRKALIAVALSTLFFVTIGFKDLSLPYVTYLFIGIVGIPSILYGVLYAPDILLIVAATYIPFNLLLPADFGGIQRAFNGTNVVLGALFFGYLIIKKKSSTQAGKRSNFAFKFVLLYVVLSMISYVRGGLIYGPDYLLGVMFDLKRWLTPFILMFFFYKIARDREIIKIIYAVFMIVVIVNVFYGLLEWVELGFGTYSSTTRRLGGINMQPNFYAAFIAYYICLIIAPFLTCFRKPSAKFLIFPILLGLRIFIPTNSRGAWLSFPPALLTVCFFKSKLLLLIVVTAVIISGLYFSILVPDTIRERFESALDVNKRSGIYSQSTESPVTYLSESKSVSIRTRAILLEGGLKMMRVNPWFGMGRFTFPHLIGNYTEGGLRGSAHNLFLTILCEMGFPALLILVVLLLLLFTNGIYVYRREKDTMLKGMVLGFMASIPAIIVCNFTGNRFDSVDLISIFWMLAGCVLRLKDIIHYERTEELR